MNTAPNPEHKDPIVQHPRAALVVVALALYLHPSAISVALIGFVCAVIGTELVEYVIWRRRK